MTTIDTSPAAVACIVRDLGEIADQPAFSRFIPANFAKQAAATLEALAKKRDDETARCDCARQVIAQREKIIERLRAERDKLLGYYTEIVNKLGHDCALREIDELRSKVAQLEGALAMGQENCDAAYDDLREDRDEARRERDELQSTFDLCWTADMRAIKRWQEANPGNDMTWPDRGKLTMWLMDQLTAAQADVRRLDWLVDQLGNDCEIGDCKPLDHTDFDEWERQGGNDCAETRLAWRRAIDAAMEASK